MGGLRRRVVRKIEAFSRVGSLVGFFIFEGANRGGARGVIFRIVFGRCPSFVFSFLFRSVFRGFVFILGVSVGDQASCVHSINGRLGYGLFGERLRGGFLRERYRRIFYRFFFLFYRLFGSFLR